MRQIISQLYPFILGRAASVTGRWAPLLCRDPMCRPDPLSDYNNPPQADFLQHGSTRGAVGSVVLTRGVHGPLSCVFTAGTSESDFMFHGDYNLKSSCEIVFQFNREVTDYMCVTQHSYSTLLLLPQRE